MLKFPTPGQEAPAGCPEAEAFADQEARRDALKRLGRYAAAAPTVMLLLAPRAGQARPSSWVPGPQPSAPPSDTAGTTRIDRPSAQSWS
jgi:hypothetical protein